MLRYLTDEELVYLPYQDIIEKLIGYNPQCINRNELPQIAILNKIVGFVYIFKGDLIHKKFKDPKYKKILASNVKCVLNYNKYKQVLPYDDTVIFITNDSYHFKYNLITNQCSLIDYIPVIGYRYYKQFLTNFPILLKDKTEPYFLTPNNTNIIWREDYGGKTVVLFDSGNISLV